MSQHTHLAIAIKEAGVLAIGHHLITTTKSLPKTYLALVYNCISSFDSLMDTKFSISYFEVIYFSFFSKSLHFVHIYSDKPSLL